MHTSISPSPLRMALLVRGITRSVRSALLGLQSFLSTLRHLAKRVHGGSARSQNAFTMMRLSDLDFKENWSRKELLFGPYS